MHAVYSPKTPGTHLSSWLNPSTGRCRCTSHFQHCRSDSHCTGQNIKAYLPTKYSTCNLFICRILIFMPLGIYFSADNWNRSYFLGTFQVHWQQTSSTQSWLVVIKSVIIVKCPLKTSNSDSFRQRNTLRDLACVFQEGRMSHKCQQKLWKPSRASRRLITDPIAVVWQMELQENRPAPFMLLKSLWCWSLQAKQTAFEVSVTSHTYSHWKVCECQTRVEENLTQQDRISVSHLGSGWGWPALSQQQLKGEKGGLKNLLKSVVLPRRRIWHQLPVNFSILLLENPESERFIWINSGSL